MLDVNAIDGFEWDKGNQDKNWLRHQVSAAECEEVFFNLPLLIGDDIKHSATEKRYYALGRTDAWRLLFVVFTTRGNKIRVISARNMSRKERMIYGEAAT